MRVIFTFLIIIIFSAQSFSQRRSKGETQDTAKVADPKDMQIDSLKNVSKTLTLQLDSVNSELVKYLGVYNAIREKVITYKFDPTRSAYLIDSLKASRDSTTALLLAGAQPKVPSDSLALLIKENTMLKAQLDSLKSGGNTAIIRTTPEDIERAKALGNLKELKELLDAKIITEAEYTALKTKYLNKL